MSTATDRLALYLAAEARILSGQSWRLGDRQLTQANLAEVQSEIEKLRREIASEEVAAAGGQPGVALADFSGCRS